MKKTIQKIISALLAAIIAFGAAPAIGLTGLFSVAAANADYQAGDLIYYGTYPQSDVTELLGSVLNSIDGEWISYNYYSGTGDWCDGQMAPSDYMRYKDVVYNGSKYRGVTFDSYRPNLTGDTDPTAISTGTGASAVPGSIQAYNNYYPGTVYWFKFEPIQWRVLDPSTGFIMCNQVIDSQAYNNYVLKSGTDALGNPAYWGDPAGTYFAGNYSYSSIRQWLNDDFYNTAFSAEQKSNIKITTLNNDGYYTLIGREGYEIYDAPSTDDKIFLLSHNEVNNDAYGLNTTDLTQLSCSDYAKSQGVVILGNFISSPSDTESFWLLRTTVTSGYARGVMFTGQVVVSCSVNCVECGICPALRLQELRSDTSGSGIEDPAHVHSYTSAVTAPTCTDRGYTTYTCTCGDSYVGNYVRALGHDFGDWTLTTSPTCTSKGMLTRYCSRCDATETQEVAATGHTYLAVLTKPTCTEKGYITYTCACGDSYVDYYADSLGHDFGEWIVTTPATCTQKGVETRYCSRCKETETREIAKADHTEGEWVVTKEPTFTEPGEKTLYCSVCGEVISTEVIPKLIPSVKEVKVSDLDLAYKDTATLDLTVTADPGAKYTTTYTSSDTTVAIVDSDGKVTAVGKGTATVTVTVTDDRGNTVQDTCKVTVKLTFWQMLLRIFMFGWIWY